MLPSTIALPTGPARSAADQGCGANPPSYLTRMAITVHTLDAARIVSCIRELARLRIAVFREWPYLYDGDAEYESSYLAAFAAAPHAVLVAAFDADCIVGMATASPMAAQNAAIRSPVAAYGFDVEQMFYFGESVLLAPYRGRGVGHAFFDAREAGARNAGATTAAFCAVMRNAIHPQRPKSARSHDRFWSGRGYAQIPDLTCTLNWQDMGDSAQTPHRLQFWHRAL